MSQSSDLPMDIQEHGANRDGTRQTLDRRLFMQLHVFGGCTETSSLVESLKRSGFEGVVYQDVNDPRGVGILAMHEDPVFFVTVLRGLLNAGPFRTLTQKLDYTMLGRTY